MLLEGKVALITGAGSERGIGRAAARRFVAEGGRIAVLDIGAGRAEEAARALGEGNRGYECDVTDEAACRAAIARAVADFGALDILVTCAGVSQPDRFLEIAPADYRLVMDVNLLGTFNICRAVMPHFRDRQAGAIVCIGSLAALRGGGVFGGSHYAASKGGVHSLAKALAREFAGNNIRVNAIAPGLVDTDLFQGRLTPEQRRQVEASVPMGRLALPEEIADACLYLASPMSTYVTGAILDVNGGLHIH